MRAQPIPWHEKLRRALALRRGARLGEATVVSRQVHVSPHDAPGKVFVLPLADAGQQFYGRANAGEVIHIDVFHAVAEVDHRRIAAAVLRALGEVPAPAGTPEGGRLLDYFDLVTYTGGGRLTGSLEFGRKLSLRVAHRNHVHLAGLLPDDRLHLLLDLVGAVEGEVQAQGVELRRLEEVAAGDPSDGSDLDMSAYADTNDSLLVDAERKGRPGGQSGVGAGGRPGGAGSGDSGGGEGGPEAGAGSGQPSEAGEGGGTGWDALEDERRLQAVLELSRRLGSPDEVKRVLDELAKEQTWGSLTSAANSQAPFITRHLESEGLIRRELRGLRLTDAGRDLAQYLETHLRDVKLRFRKLIRRMPAAVAEKRAVSGAASTRPSPDVRFGPVRGVAPAGPGTWLGDLAVPETVMAALKRTQLERIQAAVGAVGAAGDAGFGMTRADVHVLLRSADQPLNICLLIDASASMAGRRILAAKHLARHLLVSTRDRVAVVAFQERDVQVYAPFTRDYALVDEGLSRIQPMGLTPLAAGLSQSLTLIQGSRVRRPLLLLITDGIPTVPLWSTDAAADAMAAARHLGERRVPFGCIGLQPSRRYLEELTRTAGGTLHVVEELAEEALMTIAHTERFKLAGGRRARAR